MMMRSRWLTMSLLAPLVPIALLQACSEDPAPAPNDGTGIDASTPVDGSGPIADAALMSDAGPADRDADADAAATGQLFAFVGSTDGKIRVYTVDAATGAWTFAKESAAGTNPSFLAFDPPRQRVVAVDEIDPGMVRSLAFDPQTGALTERDAKPSGGAGTTHISLAPSGAWVFAANYTSGTASVLSLDATGMLGSATTTASGAMSHWAGTDPSGSFVLVPALGANVVAQYKFDATTGALTDNGTAALPAGAGPRHLAFHPSAKWAYVVDETASSVTAFDFDKTTGRLAAKQTVSALPPGQSAAGVTGAEIYVHPSGAHVYASTRSYDAIAHFTVSATTGTLTYVASSETGADRPRSFGVDPDGTLLFAGNQDANQVVGFRIDPTTGALASLGMTVDVPGPQFVGLARMPR